MLVVLLSVLTPMLIFILVVFLMRFCCAKRTAKPESKQRVSIESNLANAKPSKTWTDSTSENFHSNHQVIIEMPPYPVKHMRTKPNLNRP
jgi:NAD kinase